MITLVAFKIDNPTNKCIREHGSDMGIRGTLGQDLNISRLCLRLWLISISARHAMRFNFCRFRIQPYYVTLKIHEISLLLNITTRLVAVSDYVKEFNSYRNSTYFRFIKCNL